MSSWGFIQLGIVVVTISIIIHGAYQASLLAAALATGLIVLTLLVWTLAEATGQPPG